MNSGSALEYGVISLAWLVPLGVVVWFIVTLTGIRRATERIANAVERMAMGGTGPRSPVG